MAKQLGRWRSTDNFGTSDYVGGTPRVGASLRQIDEARLELGLAARSILSAAESREAAEVQREDAGTGFRSPRAATAAPGGRETR
jgi:hypothetical protein